MRTEVASLGTRLICWMVGTVLVTATLTFGIESPHLVEGDRSGLAVAAAVPGPGAPARVSPDGGAEPRWSRDGGTLYYLHGRTMMGAGVETSNGFEFEAPVRLFDGDFRTYERPPSYDGAVDGSFVTTRSESAPSISVLLNWPETLRSRGDGR